MDKQIKPAHRFGIVTLIGRPNAGKSTLLNYLVGEKIAIVTDKPQTTRTRIMGILTDPDWQMVLLDTPGIHKPKDRLGQNMLDTAFSALETADVVYYLVDATVDWGSGEAYLLQQLEKVKVPIFLLLNKVDMIPKEKLLPLIDFFRGKHDFQQIVPISAKKGDNIRALLKETVKCLPEGPACYEEDEMTDQPERVLAAEMIREKAILATRQEVPYAIAAMVEQMKMRSETLMDIHAVLVVERDSQKGILIGKQGQTLKWIGTEARKDIEAMLGMQVNLQLWVRVKADWRNQPFQLKNLGLEDSSDR
jgi:GTP-binding protein Era